MKLQRIICRILYYYGARHLPASTNRFFGKLSKEIRYQLCKRIFKRCGIGVNIERGAVFGAGYDIEIGDYSGMGINAVIPDGTIIGKYVMMGPNVFALSRNHRFDRIDIPIQHQGYSETFPLRIEDDVWIGRDVTILPGRTIRRGCIVGACCVLTKDFAEYSVIVGNPSRCVKSRIQDKK